MENLPKFHSRSRETFEINLRVEFLNFIEFLESLEYAPRPELVQTQRFQELETILWTILNTG
jgi:hypothetical protein